MPDAYWAIEAKDRGMRDKLWKLRRAQRSAEAAERSDRALAMHVELNQVFEAQDYERASDLLDGIQEILDTLE